jgi:hypothetical protein
MRQSSSLEASPRSTHGVLSGAGTLWAEVRHQEHSAFSIAEMLEHERAHLLPVAQPFDGYVERMGCMSSTCLVSVARNRYAASSHGAIVGRVRPAKGVDIHADVISTLGIIGCRWAEFQEAAYM